MQLLTGLQVPIYRNCNGALLGAGSGDGCADAFRAARHQHNFIFELQIHVLRIDDVPIDEFEIGSEAPHQR